MMPACVKWLLRVCDMTHQYGTPMWHGLFTCETWLIHMSHDSFICTMPRLIHLCHDAFICVPWIIHVCAIAHLNVWHFYVWHDSFVRNMAHLYVPRHIHTCHDSFIRAMTHGYVCHWSVKCVTWPIHICDKSPLYVRHDSFVRNMTHSYVPWLSTYDSIILPWRIHMCATDQSCVWHRSRIYVTSLIHMCDMNHSCVTWLIHVWHHSFVRTTAHSCVTCLTITRHDSCTLEMSHTSEIQGGEDS